MKLTTETRPIAALIALLGGSAVIHAVRPQCSNRWSLPCWETPAAGFTSAG